MKGIWAWPSEPSDQDKTLRKIMEEDEFVTILAALAKSPEGLSNAQLDRLLSNNSQWRTLSHMRELIALGFVQYHVQLFGEAGRYELTDLGKTVVPRIQASH
jgi:DNA-binding HxlR family transcriptional regulator